MSARRRINRRTVLGGMASGAACTIVPSHVLGGPKRKAPSDKLRLACIGVGGRGASNIKSVRGEHIVALCDVDDRSAARTVKMLPQAKRFRDFRTMFDAMHKDIDAVVVATPDHTHAVAAMAAMQRGKHVYCEKPLAHSIGEVRALMAAAHKHKVVTQLGNQGHSAGHIRSFCEWIWDGAIGQVTEVYATSRAKHCEIQNLPRLKEKHPIPAGVDWDLWLGPAQFRPYHPYYMPHRWRHWMPFGTGNIGDWMCHVVDPVFWALDLGAPASIHAEVKGYDPRKHALCYPPSVRITYQFPARGKRGPVKLVWLDGDWKIPRPAELEPKRRVPATGALVIGTKGKITYGSHGAGGCRLIPEKAMRAYKVPKQTIPRVRGHHADWLSAIRKGTQAGSNFDYGGPLTQLALLGLIAIRFPRRELKWDGQAARFTNCPEANALVAPPPRKGWTL